MCVIDVARFEQILALGVHARVAAGLDRGTAVQVDTGLTAGRPHLIS
jgi:hypothetical protein